MPRSLRSIMLTALFLADGASAARAQSRDTMRLAVPGPGSLSFLVMGDWGRDGRRPQRAVATQMGVAATSLDVRFVLATGDNFYPDGVRSVHDPQWRRSFEDVYTAPSLGVDWFVALGNHDYRGDPQAEVDYSATSRRWRMPARYYAVKRAVAHGVTAEFLIIDSTPFIEEYRLTPWKYRLGGTDPARQLAWIDSTLGASTATWKFIVGHHNVYSGDTRTVIASMQRWLVPLMQRHGVAAYLCGHEHHLEHITRDGAEFLISGGGSEGSKSRVRGTVGTRFAASAPGFFALSLAADSLLVQAIDAQGRLLYRTSVRR